MQKWSSFAALPRSFAGCKEPWCSRAGLQPVAPFDPLLQTRAAEFVLAFTYSAPLRCTARLALADDKEEEEDLSRFVLMQSSPDEMQVLMIGGIGQLPVRLHMLDYIQAFSPLFCPHFLGTM